jgi:KaiC/GvpD/RAD55 family RecA-like ATPase
MKDGFVGPHVKVQTGIEGLDEMLAGGLLPGRPYLVVGPVGSGKTTLALQFLLRGVRLGENVLYVTLEEPPNEIKQNFRRLPRDLDKVWIFDAIPDVMRYEKAPFKDISAVRVAERLGDISPEIRKTDEFRSVEIAFSALMQTLKMETVKRFYSRIVIDSLTALEYFCMKGFDEIQGAQVFLRFLSELKITTLLTVESPPIDLPLPERMLARGEIHLFSWEADKRIIRAIGIEKFRGSPHDSHLHPYRIASHGLAIDTSVSVSKETREMRPTPPAQESFISKPTESELALEAEWALLTLLDDVKELLERGVDPGVVRDLVQKAHSSLSSMHIQETFQYLLEARELVNHLILVHQVSEELPGKGVNLPGLMHAMSEGEELPAAEALKPKLQGDAGAYMGPLLSRLSAMLEAPGGKRIAANMPAALINRAMASTEATPAQPATKVELKKEVAPPAVLPSAPKEGIATKVPSPSQPQAPRPAVQVAPVQLKSQIPPHAPPAVSAVPSREAPQTRAPVPAMPVAPKEVSQARPPTQPVQSPVAQPLPREPSQARPPTPQTPAPAGQTAPREMVRPVQAQAPSPTVPSPPKEAPAARPAVPVAPPSPAPPLQREPETKATPVMVPPPPAPPVVPRQAERVIPKAPPVAGPLQFSTPEKAPPSSPIPQKEPVRTEPARAPAAPPAPASPPPVKVVERPSPPPPVPPQAPLPQREEAPAKVEPVAQAPPPKETIERIAAGPAPAPPPLRVVERPTAPVPTPAPVPPAQPAEQVEATPPSPPPQAPQPEEAKAEAPAQVPLTAETAVKAALEFTIAPPAAEGEAPAKKGKRAPRKAAAAPAAKKPRKTTTKAKKTLEEAVGGVAAPEVAPAEPKPKAKRASTRKKAAAHDGKEAGAEVASDKKSPDPVSGGDPPASS